MAGGNPIPTQVAPVVPPVVAKAMRLCSPVEAMRSETTPTPTVSPSEASDPTKPLADLGLPTAALKSDAAPAGPAPSGGPSGAVRAAHGDRNDPDDQSGLNPPLATTKGEP